MPLSLSERNPTLTARVDDAYERALLAQGELASGVGSVALDTIIDGDVAAAREQGNLGGSGLEAVTDPNIRTSFENTLLQSEQLFGRVNLTVPPVDRLAESGVDFAALGAAYERMDAAGLEPRLVLAPVMNTGEWSDLYRRLEADPGVNRNGGIKNGGLYIDSSVGSAWAELSSVPDTVPSTTTQDTAGGNVNWTLRLLPGTNRPTETSVAHNDPSYPDKPTVHEYLALQANLLQNGEEPIDDSTWTWLDGTFENGLRAPSGLWYSVGGQVRLRWGGVDNRLGNLGVRLPVWGE